MKILGAKVIPAKHGLRTLKEAVDSAFEAYMRDPDTQMYCIGSVVGPHPFPYMVREFQKVIGEEAKKQFDEQAGGLPDSLVASCGGGSNSIVSLTSSGYRGALLSIVLILICNGFFIGSFLPIH